MKAAQVALHAAIGDPGSLSDPARRAAAAPAALPPLRRLIADQDELTVAAGGRIVAGGLFEVQLRAFGVAFGDKASSDWLATLAADPRVPQSLRGCGGQLLARWVEAGLDAARQGPVVDDLARLDHAHPESDALAYFTHLMDGSAASPAVHDRLVTLLSGMTGPEAVRNRQATATRPS